MKKILITAISFYQNFISGLIGPCCRFHPTCSEYAKEAIELHGLLRGSWLSLKRLSKCHPLGPSGLDGVPPRP
jgi:hypothetical protein